VRGEIVARSSKFVAVLRTAGGGIDAVQQKNYPRTYPKKLGCHRKVSQILDHSALSFRSGRLLSQANHISASLLDGGGQVRQTGAATRSENVATQRAAMDEPSL
jgi:hypothetical protein